MASSHISLAFRYASLLHVFTLPLAALGALAGVPPARTLRWHPPVC